jgi:hypothetical protein
MPGTVPSGEVASDLYGFACITAMHHADVSDRRYSPAAAILAFRVAAKSPAPAKPVSPDCARLAGRQKPSAIVLQRRYWAIAPLGWTPNLICATRDGSLLSIREKCVPLVLFDTGMTIPN